MKKYLFSTLLLMMTLCLGFTGCSDDDAPMTNADLLAGNYSGTLKPIGYTDAPASCYVTIEKLSDNTVRISRLICEEFGLNMSAVNMVTKINSNGSISLESETNYSIEGTFLGNQLNLEFVSGNITWKFVGTKQ